MADYVMADIHGNTQRFESVMNKIRLKPEDTLYILGDVIDRYEDGIRILRKLKDIPNVKILRGNHEQMLLDAVGTSGELAPLDEEKMNLWMHNGGDVTLKYLKHIRKQTRREIAEYISTLPFSYEITVSGKAYLLVHAAPPTLYNKNHPRYGGYRNPEQLTIWYRMRYEDPVPTGYTLIFGHTPTIFYQDGEPLRMFYDVDRIALDCGSGLAPKGSPFYYADGRLACLRLDDMKEFYSDC